MQLFVNRLCGKSITLNVDQNDTIRIIKGKIQDVESVSVECQRLQYEGKQLQNNKTLKHYNIIHLSVLNLTLSLQSASKSIQVTIDISDVLPFIPSQAESSFVVKCNRGRTIKDVLTQVGIINIIDCIEPFIIYINQICPEKRVPGSTESIMNFSVHQLLNNNDGQIIFQIDTPKISSLPQNELERKQFVLKVCEQWKNYEAANKFYINCTEFCNVTEIAQFIPSLKINDYLLKDIMECLINLSRFGMPKQFRIKWLNESIIPSLFHLLSYTKNNNAHHAVLNQIHIMVIQCIINLIAKGDKAGTLRNTFISKEIVKYLTHFNDLCVSDEVLLKFSNLLYHLCQSNNYNEIDWEILGPLHKLLFHQGFVQCKNSLNTNIVSYAMSALIHLTKAWRNAEDDDDIDQAQLINKITGDEPSPYAYGKFRSNYNAKQAQMRLLFDGFIRKNIDYIPDDISWIMFRFYNQYTYTRFDPIERCLDLLQQKESHALRHKAIEMMTKITNNCDSKLMVRLIIEHKLLNKLILLLNEDEFMNSSDIFENAYWIISNATFFRNDTLSLVWESAIIGLSINVFEKSIMYNYAGCGSMISPLYTIMSRIENKHILYIIEECRFIKSVLLFISIMINYTFKWHSFQWKPSDVLSKIMRLIDSLLANSNHNISKVCIKDIMDNDGVSIIERVKTNAFKIDVGEVPRSIAIAILNNYFPEIRD